MTRDGINRQQLVTAPIQATNSSILALQEAHGTRRPRDLMSCIRWMLHDKGEVQRGMPFLFLRWPLHLQVSAEMRRGHTPVANWIRVDSELQATTRECKPGALDTTPRLTPSQWDHQLQGVDCVCPVAILAKQLPAAEIPVPQVVPAVRPRQRVPKPGPTLQANSAEQILARIHTAERPSPCSAHVLRGKQKFPIKEAQNV
mmetsp:Transcript_106854/g.312357  ORF Transcript_106854/g.312357 Transcript_106854/m.312357 type:complete len:201 (-) Transcript_106854:67-669(-)